MLRRAASRTTANASGRRSSMNSPCSSRPLSSPVLLLSSPSSNAWISSSKALTRGTMACSSLTLRPSPAARIFLNTLITDHYDGEPPVAGLPDVQELLPDRVDDRLHAGVQVKLFENVAHVVLYGVLGDEQ